MKILGVQIESPHDAGVALLEGDRLLYAANEERFDRVKMSGAFPERSLADCLRFTGTKPEEIGLVVFIGNKPLDQLRYASQFRRRQIQQRRRGDTFQSEWWSFLQRPLEATGYADYRYYRAKHRRLLELLEGWKAEVVCFPHHVAHGYAAYYTSGFEDPVVLNVEGMGDNRTTSYMTRDAEGLDDRRYNVWPHSVGRFYAAVTTLLGFKKLRHEGKITGLAAYGDPQACYDEVAKLLWADGLDIFLGKEAFTWTKEFKRLGRRIPPPLDGFSREDIAAAFQQRLEDVVCAWAEAVLKETGKRDVALTGGVFANVKLNQRVHELAGVDRLFVHPGMGDVGLAVGACFAGREILARREGRLPDPIRLPDVYLGPSYTEKEMEAAIRAAGLSFERHENIEEKVAAAIHAGKVVARFDGRMEYGPRALGNRSMLYHARDRAVNDWLNKKLKRTEFMPFAPACAYEAKDRLFKGVAGAEHAAEFMTVTFDATDEMKERGPAAVHVDGTARPQLVREGANPSFHKIISEYEKLSGFPSIINTSFNMHEEPIVCTPEDGVKGFVDSQVDFLAMGKLLARLG